MKLRPANIGHNHHLRTCIVSLRIARDHAAMADCPALLKKIRNAIASAGGAARHMQRRLYHNDT